MTNQKSHPFSALTPDIVMDAVEKQGYLCDGRNYVLNSYENRVYQVGIEGGAPVIAKFYRPERWTIEQILEEHQHILALSDEGVSVATPININGDTLFEYAGFWVCIYGKVVGNAPETDSLNQLYDIGQLIGKMHVSNTSLFTTRAALNPDTFGKQPQDYLLTQNVIPKKLQVDYHRTSDQLINAVERRWRSVNFEPMRLHGDCHCSNILWNNGPTLLDFDDIVNGPAVQDLWMLLSGDRSQQSLQLSTILEGYEEHCEFNHSELALIESLRSLRIIHYSAWLARRQDDPAFKQAFSWFGSIEYWQQHIKDLATQLDLLKLPPLLSQQ